MDFYHICTQCGSMQFPCSAHIEQSHAQRIHLCEFVHSSPGIKRFAFAMNTCACTVRAS